MTALSYCLSPVLTSGMVSLPQSWFRRFPVVNKNQEFHHLRLGCCKYIFTKAASNAYYKSFSKASLSVSLCYA